MPWGKRKSGEKWEVVNEESGEVKGSHDSETEADAQLAALYANANPEEETKMNKALFIPIQKINLERREVWGYGAIEQVDNSDEILDYQSTKPHMLAWSQNAQKRSGGKSMGNVRAMHQNISAGKLISLQADDVHKGFFVGAKIVDDGEWAKVEQGVYTGFSIGGSYLRRWPDFTNPGKIRYTAKPSELSIVDAPCIPGATFQVVKADGSVLQKRFAPTKGQNLIKVVREPNMIKVVRPTLEKDFNPDEPRDASGKWTSGGGGGEAAGTPKGGFMSHPMHEDKPANLSHPLHNTPDTVIGRDGKPHPVGGGGGGAAGTPKGGFMSHPQHEDKPAKLSHPLHGTADTVIGRDGEPHPVGRGGGGKTDDEWADDDETVSEGRQMASPKEMRQQLQADKNPPRPAENKSPNKPTSDRKYDMTDEEIKRFAIARLKHQKEVAESERRMHAKRPDGRPDYYNMTPDEASQVHSDIDWNGENSEYMKPYKEKPAAQKSDSQGVDMDNPNDKASMDMPEELTKAPEDMPASGASPEPIAEDTVEKGPEDTVDDGIDGEEIPADENDDELLDEQVEEDVPLSPEAAAEKAEKIVASAIIELGKLMDGFSLAKQAIPGAPENIADIPLESKVGPSFSAEQMPPPNVLLEIKPNAEPSQEVLAGHAVASKDLTDALNAWLPKVGIMLKTIVNDELDKRLGKVTQSAPAQKNAVEKRFIKVLRKE